MNCERKILLNVVILVIALGMAGVACADPMGMAFTYQGRLVDANSPAEGLYDFRFKVFNALDGGDQQGSIVDVNDVDVVDGYFMVALDFGEGIFTGDGRWLQIAVSLADADEFTTLSPRQELTPTPYALYAGGDGDWTISGSDMYSGTSGNVGIGTQSPVGKLHVVGGKAMDGTWGADLVFKAQDGGDGWAMQNDGAAGGDIILLPGEGGEESGAGSPGPTSSPIERWPALFSSPTSL